MQDHDSAGDDRAIEDSGNTFGALHAELEQAVSHGSSVRHAKIWSVDLHSLGIPKKAGDEPRWQGEHVGLNARAVEGDGPGHRTEYSKRAI